jgi:hypothetical protein
MKGIIANCLKELVCEKFGEEKWDEILDTSGFESTILIHPSEDIDDKIILTIIDSTCKVLNITLVQAADTFGEYWVNVFAPKVYSVYYKGSGCAKDFILQMNDLHKKVTKDIEGANTPGFDFKWMGDKNLIITYKSQRGLIDILVGIIKGVGIYYKEDLKVKKWGENKVEVIFPG